MYILLLLLDQMENWLYLVEFDGRYVLVDIDYFTRVMWARILYDKSPKGVLCTLKK